MSIRLADPREGVIGGVARATSDGAPARARRVPSWSGRAGASAGPRGRAPGASSVRTPRCAYAAPRPPPACPARYGSSPACARSTSCSSQLWSPCARCAWRLGAAWSSPSTPPLADLTGLSEVTDLIRHSRHYPEPGGRQPNPARWPPRRRVGSAQWSAPIPSRRARPSACAGSFFTCSRRRPVTTATPTCSARTSTASPANDDQRGVPPSALPRPCQETAGLSPSGDDAAMDLATMRRRVFEARVGRLATGTAAGRAHLVPCCFMLDGDTVFSAVDAKPKSTLALRRLDNLRAHPAASLLVDHYSDDWSQLWWVRLDR